MIVSPDNLRKDTVALIKEIDEAIGAVKAMGRPDLGLYSLLNAKATAYNTLVLLQQPKK